MHEKVKTLAIKIKCDVCSTEHGGFHLCLGRKVNVQAEQYKALHSAPMATVSELKARGAAARWALHWAENAERDRKILKMYEDGSSLAAVGGAFNLSKPTIKSIVLRLGGSIRSRNYRAS